MEKHERIDYLAPMTEVMKLLPVKPIAASPLDDYHDDNPDGDEGWDD